MPIEHDDAGLVARARRGDKEAYGDLYERYLDPIFRYVFYRVGNLQDAEDLTEQVFLKAWEAMDGYREEVPFKAWIYRIAQNGVIDHYRIQKETTSLSENGDIPGKHAPVDERLLAEDRAARLAAVLGQLAPDHQKVLTLRFINGLSMKEVADILERSEGAVRVLQHRALKAAHAYLTAEEITDA